LCLKNGPISDFRNREGWNEIVVLNGTPRNFWADQSQDGVNVVSLELAIRDRRVG
jgi:hypothetical protein